MSPNGGTTPPSNSSWSAAISIIPEVAQFIVAVDEQPFAYLQC